jgi:membrane dipeptidase
VIRREFLPRLKRGGIDIAVLAVFADRFLHEGILRECLLMIDDMHQEIAESAGDLYLIRTPADIPAEPDDRRLGVLLSIEGTEPLAADLGILRLLYELGLRAVGLTWFGRTMAADGTGEEEADGGLTRFGRDLVRECNRLGILVDVSHLSQRGFWDVLRLSQAPVIASHSNARAVHDHPRNLWDDQLRALADSGGCVGLNAYPDFVAAHPPRVEQLADHAAHMLEVMGPEHIGLGLDLVDFVPEYRGKVLAGLANHGDAAAITDALIARSIDDDTIRGILGTNWTRVWRDVLA